MTNITMLAATRPRLLKQALDSIGDLSNATVTIRDACLDRGVFDLLGGHRLKLNIAMYSADLDHVIGTGPARNEVVAVSERRYGRGDYLYLSDDDVYFLRPDWLARLIKAYDTAREFGYAVISAYNHPFNGPIPGHQWILVEKGEPNFEVRPVYAVATQSMLMSWDVWDKFGPFCDTPAGKVCQSEDVELCGRIRAAGYKVGVVAPALLVNTGITNSFGEHIPGWELVKSQCPADILCE